MKSQEQLYDEIAEAAARRDQREFDSALSELMALAMQQGLTREQAIAWAKKVCRVVGMEFQLPRVQ